MNHRESWAKEATAPSKAEYLREIRAEGDSSSREPVRKIISSGSGSGSGGGGTTPVSQTRSDASTPVALQATKIQSETLVVVSKVKKLIKDQTGFSTSQCCIDRLTKKVIEECLKGIEKAKEAERKTVMGRDIL
jgi:histone H3/H4